MTNSMNFIKKEDFFPFGCCYINNNIYNNNNYNIINNNNNDSNNYINPEVNNHNNINNNNEQNDNNNSINDEKTNNNSINDNNIDNNNIDNKIIDNKIIDNNNNDKKDEIEFDKKNININNINIFNEEYDYINNYINYMNNMNIPYSQFMDYYYNQIPDNNFISKFTLLNDFNIKNKSKSFYKYNKQFKKSKNKTNHFNKKMPTRKGDWLCNICSNLNFSFRNFCNRCKAPKQ